MLGNLKAQCATFEGIYWHDIRKLVQICSLGKQSN